MNREQDRKGNIYAYLAIAYALLQYIWSLVVTYSFRQEGIIEYVVSPLGYLPLFFTNLILSLPMLLIFLGSLLKYRSAFGKKLDYIKPDRYILTLTITTIYAFLMPLSAEVIKPAPRGAYTWFYYLFFIAFFEEFLYRGLLPSFLERSYFPRAIIVVVPALMYGLYQTALPFARYGFSMNVLLSCLPNVIISILLHYLLYAAKKWSGAMWLPIILHATFELSLFLLIH